MVYAYNDNQARFWPGWIIQLFHRYFEPGSLGLVELPSEERAGLGFGVTLLVLLSVAGAGLCLWRERGDGRNLPGRRRSIGGGCWRRRTSRCSFMRP